MLNNPPTKREEDKTIEDWLKELNIYRVFKDQKGKVLKIMIKEGNGYVEFKRQ